MRMGRAGASPAVQSDEPGGSTSEVSITTPQSSARGGGWGADVVGGADLFEHEGPEHGLGGGSWSDFGPSSNPRASRPIAGRSAGCSQPAFAEEGASRPAARSVRNAPASAFASRLGRVARMSRRSSCSLDDRSGDASRWVDRASNIQRPIGARKVVVPIFQDGRVAGVCGTPQPRALASRPRRPLMLGLSLVSDRGISTTPEGSGLAGGRSSARPDTTPHSTIASRPHARRALDEPGSRGHTRSPRRALGAR